MSGEFRWCQSSYLHSVLNDAGNECGRHAVSQAMTEMYAALAPIERGCAWYEAGDSGPDAPTLALIKNAEALKTAARRLDELARDAETLIAAALRNSLKGREA